MRVRKGNPVSGDDFWPRTDVVDELYHAIAIERGSRRMFGLRRIGKTSVLLELERRLRKDSGLVVIRIDVQGVKRFRDFLSKLFEQIPNEDKLRETRQRFAANHFVRALLPALVARIAGPAAQPQSPLTGFTNEFEHNSAWEGDIEAALRDTGGVALIIDELPFMLREMTRHGYKPGDVEAFLATLRSWRMNCGVRMLLTGSLGLAQLQRKEKVQVADHVGDLFPVQLPPLGDDDAAEMVDALAEGEKVAGWTRDLSRAVVTASAETWPIFLQYGFDAVAKANVRDPAAVKATIDGRVRQPLDETFYAQFATRLSRYDEDEKPARVLLRLVAASAPEPTAFDAIDVALEKAGAIDRRDDLLEALQEDDLIVFDTESATVRPASKLVPIWVRARTWGR